MAMLSTFWNVPSENMKAEKKNIYNLKLKYTYFDELFTCFDYNFNCLFYIIMYNFILKISSLQMCIYNYI